MTRGLHAKRVSTSLVLICIPEAIEALEQWGAMVSPDAFLYSLSGSVLFRAAVFLTASHFTTRLKTIVFRSVGSSLAV